MKSAQELSEIARQLLIRLLEDMQLDGSDVGAIIAFMEIHLENSYKRLAPETGKQYRKEWLNLLEGLSK